MSKLKIEELKKLLKPLIRDLIKEVILEEKGVLSHIIKESLSMSPQIDTKSIPFVEERQVQKQNQVVSQKEKQKIQEVKKKLLDTVGKSAYNGIDIFENTTPLSTGGNLENVTAPQSALSIYSPDDPGIPVDKIFENVGLWSKIAQGKKKK